MVSKGKRIDKGYVHRLLYYFTLTGLLATVSAADRNGRFTMSARLCKARLYVNHGLGSTAIDGR